MQTALIIALSLHVLSSVFWAGSSFTLARTGGLGGEKLLGPADRRGDGHDLVRRHAEGRGP